MFLRDAARCLLIAVILDFVLEALSAASPLAALRGLYLYPLAFIFNTLILFCMISLSLLFRRRYFVQALVCTLWLILGIINCVMHFVRVTPLGFYDFIIWLKNTSITNSYVSVGQMLLIALGVIAIVVLMVMLFRRLPHVAAQRRRALIFVAAVFGIMIAANIPYTVACNDWSNPSKAYRRYGFPYSLLRSAVDRGITRPEKYSHGAIRDIAADIQATPAAPKEEQLPNIIFLQLESFLAPDNFITVTCSEDPVPNFTRLRQSCSSGYLSVPMIGGGTANVEFEVITGMRLSDFGTGEYPYSTVLQEASCESVAYNLKALGYAAHAIHSNTATFYQRQLVFPRLGFDSFTSLEYMQDYSLNSLGWCLDRYLTVPILDALNADSCPDIIFTVTVQGHGKYPAEEPETPYHITCTGLEENEDLKNAFEYYISQLKETDDFLGELLAALQNYPEPVVLVIYGDHLPALDFQEEEFRSGSLLTTEYVIWSNDNHIAKENRNITAYQLSSYTLSRCGISSGLLTRFHQQHAQDEDYLEALHQLEYDMLYGDKYLYNGESPYTPAEMRMGIHDIVLNSATDNGKAIIARGKNFTRSSVICANDRELDTVFVDSGTLVAMYGLISRVEGVETVSVAQIASDGTILSQTEAIECSD